MSGKSVGSERTAYNQQEQTFAERPERSMGRRREDGKQEIVEVPDSESLTEPDEVILLVPGSQSPEIDGQAERGRGKPVGETQQSLAAGIGKSGRAHLGLIGPAAAYDNWIDRSLPFTP